MALAKDMAERSSSRRDAVDYHDTSMLPTWPAAKLVCSQERNNGASGAKLLEPVDSCYLVPNVLPYAVPDVRTFRDDFGIIVLEETRSFTAACDAAKVPSISKATLLPIPQPAPVHRSRRDSKDRM